MKNNPNYQNIESAFTFLHNANASDRVAQQNAATQLLFEKYKIDPGTDDQLKNDTTYKNLKNRLSKNTPIIGLNPVQEDIYNTDSGTAFVPDKMKKILLSLKSRFVIRPVCLEDLKIIIAYAVENKLKYTIRGSGSWPFGGAIPMNKEIIIDLSYLDFYDLNEEPSVICNCIKNGWYQIRLNSWDTINISTIPGPEEKYLYNQLVDSAMTEFGDHDGISDEIFESVAAKNNISVNKLKKTYQTVKLWILSQ